MAVRTISARPRPPFSPIPLILAALISLISLAGLLRVYAMPVEARTSEAWYTYKSQVGFDFSAQVKPDKFYPSSLITADQLTRSKQPVEPPVYRRVLISKFVDFIDVRVPYRFEADRPTALKWSMKVDGTLVVPGVWEKPYPLAQVQSQTVAGREVSGVASFKVPVGQLLADLETTRQQMGLSLEPLDLMIHPVFTVEAEGLRQPVQVLNNPEFKVSMRSTTTDLDDIRTVSHDKNLVETRTVPITVSFFGSDVRVALLRQVSLGALAASLVLALVLALLRRRKPDVWAQLAKLGPSLITAGSFELPGDTAVAEVGSVKELLQLHVQTERPVIRVGDTCFLLDGTTCYRLRLDPRSSGTVVSRPNPYDELNLLPGLTRAEEFVVDPWITEVQVKGPRDFLQLHAKNGRTVIRTDHAYHMLEGTVCFTLRLPDPGHEGDADWLASGPGSEAAASQGTVDKA